MKKMKFISKLPNRLLNFWDRHLVGADVILLMENMIIIIKNLVTDPENFQKKLLDELQVIFETNQFWKVDEIIESPIQIIETVFLKFYDVYWSLKERRSNEAIEYKIENIVKDFRRTLYYGGLRDIFSVPKNHFLEELCKDRKLHGPCEYFETSFAESTHHIHRDSGRSKNNRFLSSNIIIAQAEKMLLCHLFDGGILFRNQQIQLGILYCFFFN